MKSYYLLLFILFPILGAAHQPVYSEKNFQQIKGLYELDPVTENAGEKISYVYIGKNYTAFFQKAKVIYVTLDGELNDELIDGMRVDVDYVGHSQSVSYKTEQSFQIAKIIQTINGVPYKLQKVERVTMEGLYPNIDLEFFVNEDGLLQYQYLLNPNANVADINVQYSGIESIAIGEQGELQVNTAIGMMSESSPITFKGSGEKQVKSRFRFDKSSSTHTVGFSIKNYKPWKQYKIDPYIKWSTFFGGTAGERTNDLTIDDSGYVYVTGYTASIDFPVSPGAFQTTLSNQQDIAVVKLDSTGNLEWATYFGGDKFEEGNDIAVGNDGKIYVTGVTESADFPVNDTNVGKYEGGIDAILIAFQPNGNRIWSRYISGSSDDRGESVIVEGNTIYLSGSTSSNDFPTATPTSLAGDLDAFLMELDLNGTIMNSEFYGGTTAEEAFGMAVDNAGNVIIAGRTASINLPVSPTASQTSNAGFDDAFIAKYSASGNLLWSTYYGGSEFDQIIDIGVDAMGNIYFAGFTSSEDLLFPNSVSPNTNYDTSYGGGTFDGLAGKLTPAGNFSWVSYYGGSDHDEFQGVGVSSFNDLVLSGKSYSTDFDVTSNADQATLAGGADAVIVQLDSAGDQLYSSYLGGSADEDVVASEYGIDNRLFYSAGNTKSPEFPTTPGTAQPNYADNNDMFIVAFCAIAPNNLITNTGQDTIFVCSGEPLPLLDGSTPEGGSRQYTFQYQSRVPGGTFTDIPGATSEDYQVTNISRTTIFRRIVYDGECFDISPEITVFFTQRPSASFSTDDACDAVSDSIHFTNTSQANGSNIVTYKYYFGDGDSSSLANPVHLYDSARTYIATLVITTDQGCSDTVNQLVDVSFTPLADFSTSNLCANQPMKFTNLSSIQSGSMQFEWDFGDGDSSMMDNPVHFYSSPGSYTITMVAMSGSCTDTIQKSVTIEQSPLADFAFDITCPDSVVAFTNLSSIASGSITGYEWFFGDNTSSTLVNPSKTFSRGGPYNVVLVATANTGCTDTVIKSVNPDSVIVADFNFSNNCLNQATVFNNLSFSTNGTIVGHQWDFGDGNSSNLQNPTHVYAAQGDYNVSLIITSDLGCVDTITKPVSINPPPLADFAVSDVCPGSMVSFNNLSITQANDVEYFWNFGDGSNSSDFEPNKSYDLAGTYTVSLTVINDGGCFHDTSKTITVFPEPVSDFNFVNAVCMDTSISFINNSSISSGSIVQFEWDFGDGASSNQANPKHVFQQVDTFEVSLVVTSNNGCTDTSSQQVIISPQPIASFSYSSACPGSDLNFINLSTSNISNPSYFWEFGDGTSSTDFEPNKTFNSPGTYTVSLTINENGCTDDTSLTIDVLPAPIADFTYSNLSCVDRMVNFTNSSSITSGTITSYYWNFGDGSTSSEEDPAHEYAISGTYEVVLIARSSNGCEDTVRKNLNISVAPIANFTPTSTCAGQQITFVDSTITNDAISSYFIDFGDGITSNTVNPVHIYTSPGSYTVTYIVTTSFGCTDSIVETLQVSPPPSVDAGQNRVYNPAYNSRGVELHAVGSSSGGSYIWIPGSSLNDSTTALVLATPNSTTDYVVTFMDENGCEATDQVQVEVMTGFKIPTAFSPNNDGYNDYFEIVNIECYPNHNIKIYDQWGSLLYENTGSYNLNPWDGTYDGQDMPFAAYYYILDLGTDDLSGNCDLDPGPIKRVYKGTVTILR